MSIQKQTDHRSGITYAYETTYYWEKKKKQSRSKRTLIGRVDKMTGKIVPTDSRNKRKKTSEDPVIRKPGPAPLTECRHLFYGAIYLLESFANQLGLASDLRACFPESYKQLLSIAFYLILEDNNPLYCFEKWHLTHKHPYGHDIASPRAVNFLRESQTAK